MIYSMIYFDFCAKDTEFFLFSRYSDQLSSCKFHLTFDPVGSNLKSETMPKSHVFNQSNQMDVTLMPNQLFRTHVNPAIMDKLFSTVISIFCTAYKKV